MSILELKEAHHGRLPGKTFHLLTKLSHGSCNTNALSHKDKTDTWWPDTRSREENINKISSNMLWSIEWSCKTTSYSRSPATAMPILHHRLQNSLKSFQPPSSTISIEHVPSCCFILVKCHTRTKRAVIPPQLRLTLNDSYQARRPSIPWCRLWYPSNSYCTHSQTKYRFESTDQR